MIFYFWYYSFHSPPPLPPHRQQKQYFLRLQSFHPITEKGYLHETIDFDNGVFFFKITYNGSASVFLAINISLFLLSSVAHQIVRYPYERTLDYGFDPDSGRWHPSQLLYVGSQLLKAIYGRQAVNSSLISPIYTFYCPRRIESSSCRQHSTHSTRGQEFIYPIQ